MSVYDVAKQFEEKSRAVAYPDVPKKPEGDNFDNARKYGQAMARWKQESDKARQLRGEWNTTQYAIEAEFKQAIAKELGLEGHPRFDLMFRIAWDEGHSSGFNEVAIHCDTLAELLRD